jgi:hypothetical protein
MPRCYRVPFCVIEKTAPDLQILGRFHERFFDSFGWPHVAQYALEPETTINNTFSLNGIIFSCLHIFDRVLQALIPVSIQEPDREATQFHNTTSS